MNRPIGRYSARTSMHLLIALAIITHLRGGRKEGEKRRYRLDVTFYKTSTGHVLVVRIYRERDRQLPTVIPFVPLSPVSSPLRLLDFLVY